MEEGEDSKKREVSIPGSGPASPDTRRLNVRGAIAALPMIAQARYRGEKVGTWAMLALIVIAENSQNGNFCRWITLHSQFGKTSKSGTYVSILERLGLIFQPAFDRYALTVEGELYTRDILTEFRKVLNNKPSKRIRAIQAEPDPTTGTRPHPWKKGKGEFVRRPMAPIETFNELVNEVLSKKGLNKKVKYAMLRALGMKKDQARQAIDQLERGTHTERIKPILKDILSTFAQQEQIKP